MSRRAPLRFRHPDLEPDHDSDPDSDHDSDHEGSTTAVESSSPEDNYVRRVLAKQKPLAPITWRTLHQNIQVISALALTIVPVLSIYGVLTTQLQTQTAIWTFIYYLATGLGITAGYHRLWAHRSYTARKPLRYALALCGAGAFQGSIKWWSRDHRAHHRYTDTDLDPYDAQKGFWWSHIGWMLIRPRRRPGIADVSDLLNDEVVQWQRRWYLPLIFAMAFAFPTIVAGLGWGDWRGGFFYAGALRLFIVHHSTFCVNSLAHWIGEQPFDDKHSPRNHWLTAFITVGEGYHNFHHEHPQDFRNAIKWYQYDPTKWFIWSMSKLGLASQLKVFPDNEIRKGQLAMQIKKLSKEAKATEWPTSSNHLPVLTWDECGKNFIKARLGKDATSAFYGGVYDHSNAAGNLLAMMRVGCIEGGYEVESLKRYSEIIESLAVSGGAGVEGKASDLNTKQVRSTTVIKGDPALKRHSVMPLRYRPGFEKIALNGGIY